MIDLVINAESRRKVPKCLLGPKFAQLRRAAAGRRERLDALRARAPGRRAGRGGEQRRCRRPGNLEAVGTKTPEGRKRPRWEGPGAAGREAQPRAGRTHPVTLQNRRRASGGPRAGPGRPTSCTACDRVTRAPWEGSVFATLGRRVRSGRGFVDVLKDLIHLGQVRTIETEKRK